MSEADNEAGQEEPKPSKLAVGALLLSVTGCCIFLDADLESTGLAFIALGIVLALLALVQVSHSNGRLIGRGYAIAGIVFALAVVCPVTLARTFWYRGRGPHLRVICGTNIAGLAKVLTVYAGENDGNFPTAEKWCDLLIELDYTTKKQFVCPEVGKGRCHYATNPNADANSPGDMVLVFETKDGWNQFGGPEILTTDNHEGEGCNVAFVDTHVDFVKAEQLADLMWKVEDQNSGGASFPK